MGFILNISGSCSTKILSLCSASLRMGASGGLYVFWWYTIGWWKAGNSTERLMLRVEEGTVGSQSMVCWIF